MPTEHCRECEPKKPCGNLHLYVIKLKKFKKEPNKDYVGYLYVGSTGKSVEERLQDNFVNKDGKWKYNSKYSKIIRKYFDKFRLLAYEFLFINLIFCYKYNLFIHSMIL